MQNKPFVANIGFDTAENGLAKFGPPNPPSPRRSISKHRCYENPVSGKVVALRCEGGEGKSEQDAKGEEPAPKDTIE